MAPVGSGPGVWLLDPTQSFTGYPLNKRVWSLIFKHKLFIRIQTHILTHQISLQNFEIPTAMKKFHSAMKKFPKYVSKETMNQFAAALTRMIGEALLTWILIRMGGGPPSNGGAATSSTGPTGSADTNAAAGGSAASPAAGGGAASAPTACAACASTASADGVSST